MVYHQYFRKLQSMPGRASRWCRVHATAGSKGSSQEDWGECSGSPALSLSFQISECIDVQESEGLQASQRGGNPSDKRRNSYMGIRGYWGLVRGRWRASLGEIDIRRSEVRRRVRVRSLQPLDLPGDLGVIKRVHPNMSTYMYVRIASIHLTVTELLSSSSRPFLKRVR